MAKKQKDEKKECPAKRYLMKIRNYDARIESGMQDLSDLEELVTRITPVLKQDVVSSSSNQDRLGDTVAKIVDLREKINRDVDAFINLKEEALEFMKKMNANNHKNPEYYEILHQRYFKYYTFEKIATEMDYSIRNIWYLHGRALQAFENVMNEG